MEEVATKSAALENQFYKVFKSLPVTTAAARSNHESNLQLYRALLGVDEILQYYAPKLPCVVYVPKVLKYGRSLISKRAYHLAKSSCFEYVHSKDLVRDNAKSGSKPAYKLVDRVKDHATALLGIAECDVALLLEFDPRCRHPDTVTGLLECLQVRKRDVLSDSDLKLFGFFSIVI